MRITIELKQKGVGTDIIKEELEAAKANFDETNTISELAKRRALKYKNIEPMKVKQRLFGYLQRRGFSNAAILKALKSYDNK